MRPTKQLIVLIALAALLAIAALLLGYLNTHVEHILMTLAMLMAGGVVLMALWDALRYGNMPPLQWERILPKQFIQGKVAEIGLRLIPPAKDGWLKPRRLLLADYYPQDWDSARSEIWLDTLPQRSSEIRYQVTPRERGYADFAGCEYWLESGWRLWQKRYYLEGKVQVEVLPDFSHILGAELIGLQRWLNLVGVKKLPRRGLGQDFHQLRDYQDGDDIRNIDWKATSRMDKPIVRTYQDEQDQQLIFLLDCGRNMRLQMGNKSHFDHALQAMLLLSYTALKHGDAVGLFTFASDEPRFVPAHKGLPQLNQLVRGVFDIQPSQKSADFEEAVNLVLNRQKRRALVVVLSHLNHEDSHHLTMHLHRLRRHHKVLFAGLQPHALAEERARRIDDKEQAQCYLGALEYAQHSAEALRKLHIAQILTINTLPEHLSSKLINQYLQLKRAQSW